MDAQDFMPGPETLARIRKEIETYEVGRVAAARSVRWRIPVFLGLYLVAIAAVAYVFNTFADPREQWFSAPHVFLYVIGFAASFFVYSAAVKPATELQQSFRDKVLPTIFGFIGDMQYARNRAPASFDRLPRAVTGSFNRQSFDDVIAGRYDEFSFELYETTLARKAGKSTQTLFRGIILAFEMETAFPGVLIATRRSGSVSRFFRDLFGGDNLDELQSGVPHLDEQYEFHSDNADAARPLVTGRLARALDWLREGFPHEPARVALQGHDGFLLLPHNKNFFELPGVGTPLDYDQHIKPIIVDMVSLLATGALVRKVGSSDDAPERAPQ